MALARKNASVSGIFEIKIVVAERNDGWGDLAELFEPGCKTFEVRFVSDGIVRINEIACDEDIVRRHKFGLLADGIQGGLSDFWTKMNVAKQEKFQFFFGVGLVETIAGKIETIH